jgi:REP element-mobilizing transposase RayT
MVERNMVRARKHQVQLDLPRRDKNGQGRGGRRKGAGRKPKYARAGEPHAARPDVPGRYPRHIVLRVRDDVGSLRKRFMYRALREATIAVAMRELHADEVNGGFRIVHISIQRTHIHMLVEADNKLALTRGMQSFLISAAKHINAEYSVKRKLAQRRRGSVFADRYHQEIIKSPTQARRTLAYVLNNWRKHREDRERVAKKWTLDPFSTAWSFGGWKEYVDDGEPFLWKTPPTYEALVVYLPQTWLLREGWRKSGSISIHEVPSTRPKLPTR